MITDEMIHGSWREPQRTTRKSRAALLRRETRSTTPDEIAPERPHNGERHPKGIRIDWDTPILPHIIAQAVCEEATVWLDSPLPDTFIHELTARANRIYARNERFRCAIQGRGNCGRDQLWAFMRHWLAALLKERQPHLFVRLPSSYCVGREMPDRPTRTSPRPELPLS